MGKLNATPSGVAPSTRERYFPAWNQWAYFVGMRGRPAWIAETCPNWDEDIIDFFMFESHVVENTSNTIRGRFRLSASGV